MVKSDKVYSPFRYLTAVVGEYGKITIGNDIISIENVLKKHGLCLWNYPLTEIDHILRNNINVVLVECSVWADNWTSHETVYRWFEVPEDFKDV